MNESICHMPYTYWTVSDLAFQVTYLYVTPVYVLFGLFGHSLFLAVCWTERNREPAYFYQIVLAISDLLCVLTSSVRYICIACNGLIGAERSGPVADWFRSQYALVWVFAHLASPLMNACFTNSLLLAVCMSADRVLALIRPFSYQGDHYWRQIGTLITCLLMAVSSSVFDCFRRTVQTVHDQNGVSYRVIYDEEYMKNASANTLNHVRNSLRIIGLVALVICNGALLHLYRTRFTQVDHGCSKNSHLERKEAGRTILVFTVYQSVSNAISMSFLIVYYFLMYVTPSFSLCGVFLMFPIMNLACMLTYGLSFYVVLLVNQRTRQLVKRQLFCLGDYATLE